MYIVCWTMLLKDRIYTDHWIAVETLKEAKLKYEALLGEDLLYTASICKPILSTDY